MYKFHVLNYLFVFISLQVMWQVQNRPISRNKKDLISDPHFHLSEEGYW